jgi:hypothetical protein
MSMRGGSVMSRRSTLKTLGSPFVRGAPARAGRMGESSRITEESERAEKASPDTLSVGSTPDTLTTPLSSRPPSASPAARPRVSLRKNSSATSTPNVPTPATLSGGMSPAITELQPITRWEQGRMIGQGAFGRVYHGINLDTGEFLAVKQVAISVADSFGVQDASKKKRSDALAMEVELLKELDHEFIVRYLGFEMDEEKETFNVFLEYVSGGSVASLLGKFGKFEEAFTRSVSVQILIGLEYLHERRIIHRDIKVVDCVELILGSKYFD